LLRRILQNLLNELLDVDSFALEISIVSSPEMTRLNETFLRHRGSTDVLAFDYKAVPDHSNLSGEIFICTDEAKIQASRFRTNWQSELVRYAVHGLLHLKGYDDKRNLDRRRMKREENRLLKELGKRFDLLKLTREQHGASSLDAGRKRRRAGRSGTDSTGRMRLEHAQRRT
jgi:probable rRNA maturation factor